MKIPLNCLILGQDPLQNYFRVDFEKEGDLYDLKSAIIEKKNDLHNVDADNLMLYKVDIPRNENESVKALRTSPLPSNIVDQVGGVKLAEDVLVVWSNRGDRPGNHIHVLVELPVSPAYLSVSDLLRLTPPGLIYVPAKQRSNTPLVFTFRRIPTSVVDWENFENDVKSMTLSSTQMYKKENFKFDKERRVSSEEGVRSAFDRNVLEILMQVGCHQDEFFGHHNAILGVLGEPDRIIYWGNRLLLAIELKTKFVLYVDDLVSKYNDDIAVLDLDYSFEQSTIYPVHQMFGYLSHNKLRYGVLTTYDQTWFLKRDGSQLYVSSAIKYNKTGPTLLQCFTYVMTLARANYHDDPPLLSKDGQIKEYRTKQLSIGVPRTIEVEELNLDNFEIRDILGHGHSGKVFRADFYGDEVAVKICDLSQHPHYEEDILAEVAVYDTLKDLQGHCIPRLKVAGYDDMLFVLATEIVGSPVKVEELSHQECEEIEHKLSDIHNFGILHNDISSDNILVHRSIDGFRVSFIDFALSMQNHNKSEFAKEMAQLKRLLGHSKPRRTEPYPKDRPSSALRRSDGYW